MNIIGVNLEQMKCYHGKNIQITVELRKLLFSYELFGYWFMISIPLGDITEVPTYESLPRDDNASFL